MNQRWTKSKNQKQLYMFFSKLQLVCIWDPATRREVFPHLLQSKLLKTRHTKYNLRKLLPNMRDSKYPIFLSRQKSNKSQPKALQWYQHRDQLSPGYHTGVWTADKVKFSCVGELGSECSPEMQWWKEKYLEIKISSPSTPLINSAEQSSSSYVFWFSSSVKFVPGTIFVSNAFRDPSDCFIYISLSFNLGGKWYDSWVFQ